MCSLMFQVKYRTEIQFLSCFIAQLSHFANPIDFCWKTHCPLAGKGKGGCLRLVVVFSLGVRPPRKQAQCSTHRTAPLQSSTEHICSSPHLAKRSCRNPCSLTVNAATNLGNLFGVSWCCEVFFLFSILFFCIDQRKLR